MAEEDEKLGDYLDHMIEDQYVTVERGRGYIFHSPLHSSVIDYIEDERTGRPHPIEDAADHFLLRHFDLARRETFHHSMVGSERGYVRRLDGTYESVAHQRDEIISGEVPWRSFHDTQNRDRWRCGCGHPFDEHGDDDNGGPVTDETCFVYCKHCGCTGGVGR
jgi:hypothetical protein